MPQFVGMDDRPIEGEPSFAFADSTGHFFPIIFRKF